MFKRLVQVAFVVHDARAVAKQCHEEFGMGPWTFFTFDPSKTEVLARGIQTEQAMLLAHTSVGDVDWELIEPLDRQSIYAEHLKRYGEGFHHVLLEVEDYDAARSELAKRYREITFGRWRGDNEHSFEWSYFDTLKPLRTLLEIWRAPVDGDAVPDFTYP